VGSVTVSSLLLVGAMGIGWHSFDLLMQTVQTNPSFFVSDTAATAAAVTTTHTADSSHSLLKHSHGHGGVLDPNAAWFALGSVIIKEWLYRASK
jgi:divalent metal cation (Fe/Co/Zn/Cd) transporter